MNDTQAAHRAFLNRYYAFSRPFYDATRKYYLLGRDATIRSLASDVGWQRLVEIGPGTGRNLTLLHRARPDAVLGGIEASDEMLDHAKARCPWATLEHGFAEDARVGALLGEPPHRVLFSYCLSMVRDPERAIANARRSLAVGGQVVVVDFGDLTGLPAIVARGFRAYLHAFHVQPLGDKILADATDRHDGPGHYYVVARFGESRKG